MKPRVDILPLEQRQLWPELSAVPEYFVLYGGTAVALRLANRQSIDFDLFTERPVSADALIRDLPFLHGARLLQVAPNTATFSVPRAGEVKVSFFGGLGFGRIGVPEPCEDNGLRVASLLDLAAQKMKVILTRAEAKDYLDIHALLMSGVKLSNALGATQALYPEFNPVLALKALAYFGEPALNALPAAVREALVEECANVETVQPVIRLASTISIS